MNNYWIIYQITENGEVIEYLIQTSFILSTTFITCCVIDLFIKRQKDIIMIKAHLIIYRLIVTPTKLINFKIILLVDFFKIFSDSLS